MESGIFWALVPMGQHLGSVVFVVSQTAELPFFLTLSMKITSAALFRQLENNFFSSRSYMMIAMFGYIIHLIFVVLFVLFSGHPKTAGLVV